MSKINLMPSLNISKDAEDTFNKNILWGWKRDTNSESRAVYFSGELKIERQGVFLHDPYFYYRVRTDVRNVNSLDFQYASLHEVANEHGTSTTKKISNKSDGKITCVISFGNPSQSDEDRTKRLSLRRPRRSITPGYFPEVSPIEIAEFLPHFDLYIGSGMSYEAGLPTLCDMHKAFSVDTIDNTGFTTFENDDIVSRLSSNFTDTLKNFSKLHLLSMTCELPRSYTNLGKLNKNGRVGKIFSDNVDNLLSRIPVAFERTRGSGVFNERFPAEFSSSTLVVIGVAADRREIIKQARNKKMRIVVVNPCSEVSFGVQHLNYMKKRDLFFKNTADDFFHAITT